MSPTPNAALNRSRPLALCVLLLVACGPETPPTGEAPAGETPRETATPETPSATDEPAVGELPAGEGRIQFTVEGGVFPTATAFDIRSDSLRALLSGSTLNVLQRRSGNDWLSEDGQGLIRMLIFSVTAPPVPGSYDTTQYRLNFGLSPDPEGRQVKSIVTTDEVGTVTITDRTDNHVIGTFDVTGRATQMNSRDPVYRIRGSFSFARGRAR